MRPPWQIAAHAVASRYHGQVELTSVALESGDEKHDAFGTIRAKARVVRLFRGGSELMGRHIDVSIPCWVSDRTRPPGPSYDSSAAFQPGRCLEIFFVDDGPKAFAALGEPLYFVDAPTDTPCMVYTEADTIDPSRNELAHVETRGSVWASRRRLLVGVVLSVAALTFFVYVLRSLFDR